MSVVKFRDLPLDDLAVVRFWDFAATKPSKQNPDPDFTAGCLLGVTTGQTSAAARGEWYVIDHRQTRDTPAKVEDFLWEAHEHDDALLDRAVPVRVEMEGGSGGLHTVDQLARGRFVGIDFAGRRPKGDKRERAKPAAIAAERGHVHLVEGAWNEEWLSCLELFPDATHDDAVDAFSGAFAELAKLIRVSSGTAVSVVPKGSDDEDSVGEGAWQVAL